MRPKLNEKSKLEFVLAKYLFGRHLTPVRSYGFNDEKLQLLHHFNLAQLLFSEGQICRLECEIRSAIISGSLTRVRNSWNKNLNFYVVTYNFHLEKPNGSIGPFV